MKYWLDLFTGKTWEEFLECGATVSGFRISRKNMAKKIKPGDYFLCYLTGISRFIGVLEVKSNFYLDETPIWKDDIFPVRFEVALVYKLAPKTAIPVLALKNELSIFKGQKSSKGWTGIFRGSPNELKGVDGQIIVKAIQDALTNPIVREYDEKKYWRRAKTYESKVGIVTVPEELKEEALTASEEPGKMTHEEMQWLLLKLGSDLGLDVWVAKNDRNKNFNGLPFKDIPNLREELPVQFDAATHKTIELIDVLWLQGDTIVAAFEVEHSSAIYSGLLRMSDLIVMQPNIKINLYIVAPDERRDKVFYEINRPTFAKLKPPLPHICKYIPYSRLKRMTEQISGMAQYVKAEYIEEIAESCETDEA